MKINDTLRALFALLPQGKHERLDSYLIRAIRAGLITKDEAAELLHLLQ